MTISDGFHGRSRPISLGWLAVVFAVGCGGEPEPVGRFGFGFDEPLSCRGTGPIFATHVLEVAYGPGQDFGRAAMPDIALGPPRGAGCCAGSTDVVSLGNGGTIVVGFADNGIVDGPGDDFVIFENPFEFGGALFAELATVEVSEDGESWHAFSCDAVEPPYGSCAGHHPVFLDGEGDLADAGGDRFDLADLGLDQARFLRVTDRVDLDGAAGVFDLDAAAIINPACP
jgi:hypothetical protein